MPAPRSRSPAALRRRLDAVGVVHARTYDADERRYGIDGSVGVEGVQLGASLSRTLLDSHLVAAPPGGWTGCGACARTAWTRV